MAKFYLLLGSINALLVVLIGAFGAHGLKARLTVENMAIFQTGVQYHFYHAVGLILVGLIATQLSSPPYLRWSAWLMVMGIILFSGSLYALAFDGPRFFGPVTPFGGLSFMIGWFTLAVVVAKLLKAKT